MTDNPQTREDVLPVEQIDRDAANGWLSSTDLNHGVQSIERLYEAFARHRLNALKAGGGNAI